MVLPVMIAREETATQSHELTATVGTFLMDTEDFLGGQTLGTLDDISRLSR